MTYLEQARLKKILVKLKIPVNIDTTFIIANVIALTGFAAYILREKLLKKEKEKHEPS